MAQRGQKTRAEETEEQRNKGLSHMAQRGLERKTEETEEQRNSRLSDMAQRIQERRAKEIRITKEWSIENHRDSRAKAIYTEGSKTDECTDGAYYILENYGIIASWQGLCYLGNECADQLAKGAITKGDPFFLPKPLSYLKYEIRSAALSIWQDNWDNGETGRSTHGIVLRVSNKPVGWKREELMFVTGHRPFPSYLHRFNLRTHDNCPCGEKGDPIHYATKCRFTLSWHFQTSTVSH
ncbi:hypothetical protein AVEN_60969-1 [Araneus ventricosus]|uniref:STPR domain-containing protein n=1 Tax=Araneus ventricosus TaxID=182803 RepID=A0A4Y2DBT1_ARAVE|nr:hypothetical protein AVEN_60969-1 [Araneus ventricosus]